MACLRLIEDRSAMPPPGTAVLESIVPPEIPLHDGGITMLGRDKGCTTRIRPMSKELVSRRCGISHCLCYCTPAYTCEAGLPHHDSLWAYSYQALPAFARGHWLVHQGQQERKWNNGEQHPCL